MFDQFVIDAVVYDTFSMQVYTLYGPGFFWEIFSPIFLVLGILWSQFSDPRDFLGPIFIGLGDFMLHFSSPGGFFVPIFRGPRGILGPIILVPVFCSRGIFSSPLIDIP